jgi:dUTP pyrophosphatase
MKAVQIINRSCNPDPQYATEGSAGCDLRANQNQLIQPGQTVVIQTGLFIQIPTGYEGQVRTRSGLGKAGIVVANSPGTIDSDYTGEIGVILRNESTIPFVVEKGMAIAQMVFAEVKQAMFESVKELRTTKRGSGGFGSTGLK